MFEREDDLDMVFFGVTGEAGVDREVTELGLLSEVSEMTECDLMGLGGSIGSDGMDGPSHARTHGTNVSTNPTRRTVWRDSQMLSSKMIPTGVEASFLLAATVCPVPILLLAFRLAEG